LIAWWGKPPLSAQVGTLPSGPSSNIHPADYVGPEACRGCHPGNYESWSMHPHRWMNARADEASVKGDFSGRGGISYQGGRATFVREDHKYVMRLERDGVRRTYHINQTIGWKVWQRYVGKQVEGPEPPSHPFYSRDHVLPFSYWIEQKEWVPNTHVGPEVPDDDRPDAFMPPDHGIYYAEYSISCNYCHTTFPLGDQLCRFTRRIGEHAPVPMHWSMRDYLGETHPDEFPTIAAQIDKVAEGHALVRNPMGDWEASRYAVTLGISCEACHLGGRAHVESKGRVPPSFFPTSPYLRVEAERPPETGRTHANVNWACGRCHTGGRPQFAAGMSTWNSVEYADAMRGSCYSRLRCVDCHNPHQRTGARWSLTAGQDDALCLKCHSRLAPAAQRLAHTHHPPGSDGDRCMNCHMPKINEGLRDVVRTHMIYSPTRADMIEANHPNACNLCHTRQPINWTLRYLQEWYGKRYDEDKISASYPDRAVAVARGWLVSENPSVRLVAVEALIRAGDRAALPQLVDALDDPYLVNREFACKGLQDMLGLRLRDFGYRVWLSRSQRRQSLTALRARIGTWQRGAPGGGEAARPRDDSAPPRRR
jgi:predicted CXXCH cytochrome family protein